MFFFSFLKTLYSNILEKGSHGVMAKVLDEEYASSNSIRLLGKIWPLLFILSAVTQIVSLLFFNKDSFGIK